MRSDAGAEWLMVKVFTCRVEMVVAPLTTLGSGKTWWGDSRWFPCERFQKRDEQWNLREALAT